VDEGPAISSAAYKVKELFFLGPAAYNFSADIRDKCCQIIAIFTAVSPLVLNADFITQVAFT